MSTRLCCRFSERLFHPAIISVCVMLFSLEPTNLFFRVLCEGARCIKVLCQSNIILHIAHVQLAPLPMPLHSLYSASAQFCSHCLPRVWLKRSSFIAERHFMKIILCSSMVTAMPRYVHHVIYLIRVLFVRFQLNDVFVCSLPTDKWKRRWERQEKKKCDEQQQQQQKWRIVVHAMRLSK